MTEHKEPTMFYDDHAEFEAWAMRALAMLARSLVHQRTFGWLDEVLAHTPTRELHAAA